jgi:hypothetical protein
MRVSRAFRYDPSGVFTVELCGEKFWRLRLQPDHGSGR